MLHRSLHAGLAALLAAAAALPAHAADISLGADGAWHPFSVDSYLAPSSASLNWIDDNGAPLAFTFVVGAGQTALLTVVDAGFAGDMFSVTNAGVAIGSTSQVAPASYPAVTDVGTDYGAAFANPAFSRGVFNLGSGTYRISGAMTQSVNDEFGAPLDSTTGAVQLSVLSVPEPSSWVMALAGLCAMGAWMRRRQQS